MNPYCHMGEMCLGCSPQLIEGICPDSKAGRTVAELVEALCLAHDYLAGNGWDDDPRLDTIRAAIAKATGEKA